MGKYYIKWVGWPQERMGKNISGGGPGWKGVNQILSKVL